MYLFLKTRILSAIDLISSILLHYYFKLLSVFVIHTKLVCIKRK